ncbi:MAG: hypothetical protein MJZ34_02995 [Paludibacteraceae bacterium]|nr:hypothetical protein [Paludibacteraceae bacterium]
MNRQLFNFSRVVRKYFSEDLMYSENEVFCKNFMHYFGKIFKDKLGIDIHLTGEPIESKRPFHDTGKLRRIDTCVFEKDNHRVKLCYVDGDTLEYDLNDPKARGISRVFDVVDSNTDISKEETCDIPIDDTSTGFREALVVALNRIIEDLFYQCHQSFDFEKNGKNFFEEMFLHKFPLDTDGDNNDPLEKELTQVTPKDIDDEEGDA